MERATSEGEYKGERLQYRWVAREEGFTALEHEIIYRDLCTGCGACAAVCPVGAIAVDDFPKLVDKCIKCGYCLMQCPRSFLPEAKMEKGLYGEAKGVLGSYVYLGAARSARTKGQDGGVVTALLNYLFEKGEIDGAVVSGVDAKKPWVPKPMVVKDRKGTSAASGSRYSTSPNLASLREAQEKGLKKLAFIGLPCHIQGLRKMQLDPVNGTELGSTVKYAISIFCSKNFLNTMLDEIIVKKYKIKLNDIKKFDIKGKNLVVYAGKRTVEVPLKELKEHSRAGCSVCYDFTGKLADLAIGSAGSPEGYSTVIARSKGAERLIKAMEKAKLIETKKADVGAIEKLADLKYNRARKEAGKRIRDELPLPFKFMEL